ncbi:MAG: PAS domain-containing protein, partial [Polyangiaceae bacterium]|nr:PAS domain-containing protein [Polyangiaceae bacterium]
NEELQSSQEELKSVNEELATVNAELGRKIDEVGRSSDLQNLLTSTELATLFLDGEQRVARFTPAAKALFRLIEADVGRPLRDLAPRFKGHDLAADVAEVLRARRPVEQVVEAVDGQAWYLLRVLPYRTAQETVAGAVVTLADISQIKRAEEALRESEERFRALTETSSEVLYRMSPDWSEMRQLHSRGFLTETSAANRDWLREYIPPDDQPRVLSAIQEAIRDRRVFELEHRVIRADGTVGWTLSRAIPQKGPGGEILEWFGAASDVTRRKLAELAIEEANERLREADQHKNEFLAMLSHELRNPLAPIRNSIYLLERAAPGGEQARRAQAVLDRQVGHLSRLIDDLLDVTRISSGKVRLQREVLDLREVVRRAVEDHRGAFAEAGVELEMPAAPEEVWVDGDGTRLSQVIGNLLQNAVKFTPRGGATTVLLEKDADRDRAAVRVRDTGHGIAPEILPRLFEPFTQADRTLERSRGGLGLGLALVKGLVEMHGGSVSASSGGPDDGATFTISLPLAAAGPREAAERPRAGAGGAPRRLLVIEDNRDAADTLREVLELVGYEVAVAYGGPEGIDAARAFGPDVVFCDIGLPGMDGYDVARAMRADEALRRATLVALTGYAGPEDVARAGAAGFDAHLAKPPAIEAIERVLRGAPGARPSG